MYKIRLQSPFRQKFSVGDYTFAAEIPIEHADALLCEWSPHGELLFFHGPKTWYHNEAQSPSLFSDPKWQVIKNDDGKRNFLSPSHPNPANRVPMITHLNCHNSLQDGPRAQKAIAVISNIGVNFQNKSEIILRNQFAVHSLTELYGNEQNWGS